MVHIGVIQTFPMPGYVHPDINLTNKTINSVVAFLENARFVTPDPTQRYNGVYYLTTPGLNFMLQHLRVQLEVVNGEEYHSEVAMDLDYSCLFGCPTGGTFMGGMPAPLEHVESGTTQDDGKVDVDTVLEIAETADVTVVSGDDE